MNSEWRDLLGEVEVEVLTLGRLDHKPILLFTREIRVAPRWSKKIFRFEASWTKEQERTQIIEDSWKRE